MKRTFLAVSVVVLSACRRDPVADAGFPSETVIELSAAGEGSLEGKPLAEARETVKRLEGPWVLHAKEDVTWRSAMRVIDSMMELSGDRRRPFVLWLGADRTRRTGPLQLPMANQAELMPPPMPREGEPVVEPRLKVARVEVESDGKIFFSGSWGEPARLVENANALGALDAGSASVMLSVNEDVLLSHSIEAIRVLQRGGHQVVPSVFRRANQPR